MRIPDLFPLACLTALTLSGAAPGPYRIDTIAGSSLVGDGGPAALAPLRDAESICLDSAGNIYLADAGDHRIRQISPSGIIASPAGIGFPSTDALNLPYGVAVDPAGNIFIADLGNNRIRRISAAGATSTAIANLRSPRNVLSDPAGNIYISEFNGQRILRLNVDGSTTVIAGTGTPGADGDGGPAALARLNFPAGLALDRAGNLYFADSANNKVRRISAAGIISTVLGTGIAGFNTAAQLNTPTGVAIDAAGTLYVADAGNGRIRKLTASASISTISLAARDVAIDQAGSLLVTTGAQLYKILPSGAQALIAGDGSYLFRGDGGPATSARLNGPSSVAMDAAGNIWFSDQGNARIRMISASGAVSTVAGPTGLNAPAQLIFDNSGNLLIADPSGAAIRGLTGSVLTRLAGNGAPGYSGEGYPAASTSLWSPGGVAPMPGGVFYVADTANHRIRRANAGGILITVAGNGVRGNNGDGFGIATQLDSPNGIALDASGVLYFAETGNSRVRKLTPDGQVTTIATGPLLNPRGVAVDAAGNLYIADTGNNRVLAVGADGSVSVIAGTSVSGFNGDGGAASQAQLSSPAGIFVDNATGSVYIADSGNQRIRRLTPAAAAPVEAAVPSITVVNTATLQAGPVAACSVVSIFGWYPGSNVAGVSFDGNPGTLLSPNTAQVPCGIDNQSATQMLIVYTGAPRATVTLAIAAAAPGLFALGGGAGQAVAANQDGSVNSQLNPAPRGSLVTFYATGVGLNNAVGVVVGSSAGTIAFSGDAPGLVGITQINVQLPPDATGIVPVLLLAGNVPSQPGVTLAIQ